MREQMPIMVALALVFACILFTGSNAPDGQDIQCTRMGGYMVQGHCLLEIK